MTFLVFVVPWTWHEITLTFLLLVGPSWQFLEKALTNAVTPFLDIERRSVSVECGVDYIQIGVNRTALLGTFHELALSMGDFEDEKCLTWESEKSHYFRSELGRCGYSRQVRE